MSQYCFLLGFSHKILSRSSHWIVGKRIYIYSRVRRNVKRHILPNRVFWRLDLAIGLSCEFKQRANGLASLELLSCSEQLARLFSFWHAWHVCFNLVACRFGGLQLQATCEIQLRVPISLHTLEQFFTLSHTHYPYMILT